MPPRVSSSVHGLWPGERAMRFLSWHEFDGPKIHVQPAAGVDREGVHRMVAAERQGLHDGIGGAGRRHGPRRQRVAQDLVVRLRVQRPMIQRDAGAAGAAALYHGALYAEANDKIL